MKTTVNRAFVAMLAATLLWSVAPAAASAATVAELKARLDAVQSKYSKAGAQVSLALDRLDETDAQISDTQRKRAQALEELKAAQKRLGARANRMYRSGAVSPIAMLVGATSFDELVTRYDYLKRIGNHDAAAVYDVKIKREKLAQREKELQVQRDQRAADVRSVKARRAELEKQLQATSAEYEKARVALARARAAEAARKANRPVAAPVSSGVVVAPGANGMVFPVAGPCTYADTWGAPRSGGRSHQGTDIMASRGVPVVATVNGTVRAKNGGLGGKTIWLTGGGWSFYYAHLDGWAVTSGSVKAGQVIGWVGATGNASGGAPHLHFEMHPGGGGATNPYPYLRRMQ